MNIRDKDHNIIKNYCYNYAGQANGCYVNLPVYQSPAISQNYTNTCGNVVAYTLPQGAYTSNISVQDAYNKAYADAQANGPNYANTQNNTCTPTQQITFTLTNLTNISYQAYFSSPAGNIPANFLNNNTTTVQIPAGSYSVNVYPPSGPYTAHSITLSSQTPVNQPRTSFSDINITTGSSELTIIVQ